MHWGLAVALQGCLGLTKWLAEAPLPLALPLPPAVLLLRRACSWSNSKSSRRWVKASFCWMAMRSKEFKVFFSSSAAASCLCMSSSWVTYSSHLRGGEEEYGEGRVSGIKQMLRIMSSRWSNFPGIATAVTCFLHSPTRWREEPASKFLTGSSVTSDCSHNTLCLK